LLPVVSSPTLSFISSLIKGPKGGEEATYVPLPDIT
jgi:hypothetical protein